MTARDLTDFVRALEKIDRSRKVTEIFRDYCHMAYSSIARSTPQHKGEAEALEVAYDRTLASYRDPDTVERDMGRLLGLTAEIVKHGERDFLGEAAAEIGALSAQMGQFFTPYSVSRMTARMMLCGIEAQIEERGFITVHEPAAGAGGMCVALADELACRGFHPATHIWMDAVELNGPAYHMAYLQMAIRGIAAKVTHGDSLTVETYGKALTPATIAFFERHGSCVFRDVLDLGVMAA